MSKLALIWLLGWGIHLKCHFLETSTCCPFLWRHKWVKRGQIPEHSKNSAEATNTCFYIVFWMGNLFLRPISWNFYMLILFVTSQRGKRAQMYENLSNSAGATKTCSYIVFWVESSFLRPISRNYVILTFCDVTNQKKGQKSLNLWKFKK